MGREQLKQKKKRPLIVICSEGFKKSSEYYYFSNYSSRELRIQFSTGNSTDPKGMLDDLLKYIVNEDIKNEENCKIFLLIDTDLNNKRIKEIEEISPKCIKNNIEIISSSPTFEIWFLMHYRNKELIFSKSKQVKNELLKYVPSYKENINIYDLIKDKTSYARKNAKLYIGKKDDNIKDILNKNPHTLVYKILDTIDFFNN